MMTIKRKRICSMATHALDPAIDIFSHAFAYVVRDSYKYLSGFYFFSHNPDSKGRDWDRVFDEIDPVLGEATTHIFDIIEDIVHAKHPSFGDDEED